MIIIWGTRTRRKEVSSGQFYCPRCSTERYYAHKRIVKYFTLFFIPLIPLNTVGEYVECRTCHQAFKPEVLDYAPPSQTDQFLGALITDLESGTPLQMLHRKLINAGIEPEPAKVALAAAIAESGKPENLRLCPECELLYLNSVLCCSLCGTTLIEMPRTTAEPPDEAPDEEEDGTEVDATYSMSAPTSVDAKAEDLEKPAVDDTPRSRKGCLIALLAGIGLLAAGATVALLIIFAGVEGTQGAAPASESTEKPLSTDTPANTSGPTETPRPTRTFMPGETPAPMAGDVLLQESFSGPDSEARWLLGNGDDSSAVIADGQLELSIANPDGLAWAENRRAYSGMDLCVDATILGGREEATYGILFGFGSSDDDYAVCFVRGDDSALCGEGVGNDTESGELVRVEVSPQGHSNRMRLITWGDQWAFYVNGQCAGSGESEIVERGKVGLFAMTDSDSLATEIAYDDLVVRTPNSASRALLGCDPEAYAQHSTPQPQLTSTLQPQPTRPLERGGNGTVYLSSETSAEATCRLSVWGGNVEDFLLDAGPGYPASRVVPAGEHAWQMHFGPAGRTDADTMLLPSGGSCTFVCTDSGVRWGCSR